MWLNNAKIDNLVGMERKIEKKMIDKDLFCDGNMLIISCISSIFRGVQKTFV